METKVIAKRLVWGQISDITKEQDTILQRYGCFTLTGNVYNIPEHVASYVIDTHNCEIYRHMVYMYNDGRTVVRLPVDTNIEDIRSKIDKGIFIDKEENGKCYRRILIK
ncbi:MAG: hypothetical protein AABY32_03965 [Nanoarchaeota archaeon]